MRGETMTNQEPSRAAAEAALRRLKVLDEILWRLRQEILPARMIRAALSAMMEALAADGAALLDALNPVSDGPTGRAVRHNAGGDATPVLGVAANLLADALRQPTAAEGPDGHQVLVGPCHAR